MARTHHAHDLRGLSVEEMHAVLVQTMLAYVPGVQAAMTVRCKSPCFLDSTFPCPWQEVAYT